MDVEKQAHQRRARRARRASPDIKPSLDKPLTITVKRACALTDVGATTMYGLMKSGQVATTKIGRRRLIIFKSLEALVTPTS